MKLIVKHLVAEFNNYSVVIVIINNKPIKNIHNQNIKKLHLLSRINPHQDNIISSAQLQKKIKKYRMIIPRKIKNNLSLLFDNLTNPIVVHRIFKSNKIISMNRTTTNCCSIWILSHQKCKFKHFLLSIFLFWKIKIVLHLLIKVVIIIIIISFLHFLMVDI